MNRYDSYDNYLKRIVDANGGDENLPMVTVSVSARCNRCSFSKGKTDSAATEPNAFLIATGALLMQHHETGCAGELQFNTVDKSTTTPKEAKQRRQKL